MIAPGLLTINCCEDSWKIAGTILLTAGVCFMPLTIGVFVAKHLGDLAFLYQLQLKRGLFWYRHYPKLHQMVKYGSSRALVWTIRRQITLRVFFNSKK